MTHTAENLGTTEYLTEDLEDFFRECFNYQFKERPRYELLRSILYGLLELEESGTSKEGNEELKMNERGNLQSK